MSIIFLRLYSVNSCIPRLRGTKYVILLENYRLSLEIHKDILHRRCAAGSLQTALYGRVSFELHWELMLL